MSSLKLKVESNEGNKDVDHELHRIWTPEDGAVKLQQQYVFKTHTIWTFLTEEDLTPMQPVLLWKKKIALD